MGCGKSKPFLDVDDSLRVYRIEGKKLEDRKIGPVLRGSTSQTCRKGKWGCLFLNSSNREEFPSACLYRARVPHPLLADGTFTSESTMEGTTAVYSHELSLQDTLCQGRCASSSRIQ